MADEVPPEESGPMMSVTDEELANYIIYGVSIAVFAAMIPILSKVKSTISNGRGRRRPTRMGGEKPSFVVRRRCSSVLQCFGASSFVEDDLPDSHTKTPTPTLPTPTPRFVSRLVQLFLLFLTQHSMTTTTIGWNHSHTMPLFCLVLSHLVSSLVGEKDAWPEYR